MFVFANSDLRAVVVGRGWKSAIAWVLCVVALGVGSADAASPVPAAVAATPVATVGVGQPFPKIKGLDQYNNRFTLSKLRGNYVLIDFSAWWCPPSKQIAPWIGALARKAKRAGIPFETLTILLQDDDEMGNGSTRAGAEGWSVASGVERVLYNPYDPAEPKSNVLWNAYQAVGGDAVPFFVMVGPDGNIVDIHSGNVPAQSWDDFGQALFDYVTGFTGGSLTAGLFPGDVFDSADVTVHFATGGDSTILLEPLGVHAPIAFTTGPLSAPGAAGIYATEAGFDPSNTGNYVQGGPMPHDTSTHQRIGAQFVVELPGGPPPVGPGYLDVTLNSTRPFGFPATLNLQGGYCQDDPIPVPHDVNYTVCASSAGNDVGGRSLHVPFEVSESTDTSAFPYTTDWLNASLPIRTHLEVDVSSILKLPGRSLEDLATAASSQTWDPKAVAWVTKALTKAIRGIPSGKACKKIDAIVKKVGTYAGAQIPQADAAQLSADVLDVKSVLPCSSTSIIVPTPMPSTTPTPTPTPFPTSNDIVCCDFPGTDLQQAQCSWDTASNCFSSSFVPGPAGSACDGATGKCAAAASPGPCCQGVANATNWCGNVPSIDAAACANAGGTYFASAVCGADGLCAESQKLAFVTSTMSTGNLGGLAGADATCASLAAAAGLPGTYMAWLSSSGADAATRLTHATVPYYLVDGTTKVADDWTALVGGTLAHAITLDEHGNATGGEEAWTGTGPSGLFEGDDCSGWTDGSSSALAEVGISNTSTASWTSAYLQFCDRTNVRLYCLEQ